MRDLAAKGFTKNFEPPNSLQLTCRPRFVLCGNGFLGSWHHLSELFFFVLLFSLIMALGDLMYSKHPAPYPLHPCMYRLTDPALSSHTLINSI